MRIEPCGFEKPKWRGSQGFGVEIPPDRVIDEMVQVNEEAPVTWLMLVRNGMPHLRATLDSIFRQTHRRQRLIVWDNGSNDGTVEELHRWLPHRLGGEIHHERPLTPDEALSHLAGLARTDLCARVDGGDVNHPDRLQRQTKFLAQNPGVVAAGSAVRAIDEQSWPFSDHGWNFAHHEDDWEILHDLLGRAAVFPPAMMFRRKAVLEAAGSSRIGRSHDHALQLLLALRGRFANLPEHLVNRRVYRGAARTGADASAFEKAQGNSGAGDAGFARAGAPLFGVREDVLLRLRRREHPFALPALFAIIRNLERRESVGRLRRLRSRSFREGAVQLVAERDRLTRAVLRLGRRR